MDHSDSFFGDPYVDLDQWRDAPRRHRYLHGGFKNTDTRFSIYLPDANYQGRFLQFLQGGAGGSEYALERSTGAGFDLAAEAGAYLLESNQGHLGNDMSGLKGDVTVLAYRASAQSARFAATVAEEHYGEAPHHGYVWGGSGGGTRSIQCLEGAPDVYAGAVPFMIGHPAGFLYSWSILAWAESILVDKLPEIVDAMDSGGSRDPFGVCDNDLQREALAKLYRAGFARGSEFLIEPVAVWIFALNGAHSADPQYFARDFWQTKGYAGADPDSRARAMLVEESVTVSRVITAREVPGYGEPSENAAVVGASMQPPDTPVGVVVEPAGDRSRLLGARITINSGKASGRTMYCSGQVEDYLLSALHPEGFANVRPGDTFAIDNRDLIAYSYLHRHVTNTQAPEMAQFAVDGHPIYPQRAIAPLALRRTDTGSFSGKMILIQHANDRECWPSAADQYCRQVIAAQGESQARERLRLWWVENAAHFLPTTPKQQTRLVEYTPIWAQAVCDVIDWVEKGIDPPPDSAYRFGGDNRLLLPPTAHKR